MTSYYDLLKYLKMILEHGSSDNDKLFVRFLKLLAGSHSALPNFIFRFKTVDDIRRFTVEGVFRK